jgi:thiol:disulfide interchange protein DsbC
MVMRFYAVTKSRLVALVTVSLLAGSFSLSTQSSAAEEATTSEVAKAADVKPAEKGGDVRAQIAKHIPGAKPEDVRPSPVNGLYEVTIGASVGYASSDGKFLIAGDLFDLDSQTNITKKRRAEARAKVLATLKDDQLIVFSPENPKYTITVFTDVDCGYCRKLHSEIAEYTKRGIRVRYAAFPRSGPGTSSWRKAEAVWCSKDRQQAITLAKQGQVIDGPKCATPVAAEYQVGEDLGVDGTPAVFTASGDQVGGYVPAAQLIKYLDKESGAATASARVN